MNQKLVCKSNYVLRKVLNHEEHLDILQDFVEAILGIEVEKIILRPYLKDRKELPSEENFGIAELRIITKERKKMNIGIQIIDGSYVENKILIYLSLVHTNQVEYDEDNSLEKTVTINLLDFNFFDKDNCHWKFVYGNKDGIQIIDSVEMHVLEMKKVNKTEDEISERERTWIEYLGGDEETSKKAKEKNKYIQKLDELLDKYWEHEKIE